MRRGLVPCFNSNCKETRLEILDNGSGTVQVQEGFGLSAMKERAYRLQGQVTVYSTPDEGTVVTCDLPRILEPADEIIRILLVDNEPLSGRVSASFWSRRRTLKW